MANNSTKKKSRKADGKAETSALLKNILLSKGVTEAQIRTMNRKGIRSREDFREVGDAGTLAELTGVSAEAAAAVMSWALGTDSEAAKKIVLESGDVVHCVHCGTKQPKDYKSGDLCGACGKQAEPILACFWCASTGPGKFCRQCGAEFVPPGELELAVLLKHEGQPKKEIPQKLHAMSAEEKNVLWGRARRYAR
jgi:hypothetical protein